MLSFYCLFIRDIRICYYKKARYLENKKKIAEAKQVLENQKNEITELYDNVKKSTENSINNKRLNMILHKEINEKIHGFSNDIENAGSIIYKECIQKNQDNASKE
jgi:hypothetical protein